MRLRRRNTLWLAIIGALVALVLVSGAASPGVALALIALFGAAAFASLVEINPRALQTSPGLSPLARMRMSPQAREAAERARRREAYTPPGLTLLDIGLISLHTSAEGMLMRRSRTVSLDDNGVRPYLILQVDGQAADRQALVRFEILDAHGEIQFVHELKTFLRDGEMNILADHHLPLAGNDRLASHGDWDLRAYVDGALLGVLGFTVTPSLEARRRQLTGAALERLDEVGADADDALTLEELMRMQDREARR